MNIILLGACVLVACFGIFTALLGSGKPKLFGAFFGIMLGSGLAIVVCKALGFSLTSIPVCVAVGVSFGACHLERGRFLAHHQHLWRVVYWRGPGVRRDDLVLYPVGLGDRRASGSNFGPYLCRALFDSPQQWHFNRYLYGRWCIGQYFRIYHLVYDPQYCCQRRLYRGFAGFVYCLVPKYHSSHLGFWIIAGRWRHAAPKPFDEVRRGCRRRFLGDSDKLSLLTKAEEEEPIVVKRGPRRKKKKQLVEPYDWGEPEESDSYDAFDEQKDWSDEPEEEVPYEETVEKEEFVEEDPVPSQEHVRTVIPPVGSTTNEEDGSTKVFRKVVLPQTETQSTTHAVIPSHSPISSEETAQAESHKEHAPKLSRPTFPPRSQRRK